MRFYCALGGFLGLVSLCFAAFDPVAFNAAVDLYNQHKPLEAQRAFEALAQANPDNPNIPFYLGRLALQRNDADEAVAQLEKAVALKPGDARFHVRLGDAYGSAAQKAGLFSQLSLAHKCKAEYEKAIELDPKNIEAHFGLMSFDQEAPGIAGGGLDKALVQAQEIKKLDAARGRTALASVYIADKKYAEAFTEFDEALQATPDDYSVLYQMGRLVALSGERTDQGLAALRKCLTLVPPEGQPPLAAVHWRIGNILEQQGDKPGARAAYAAALKVDPTFAQAIAALKKLN